MVELEIIEKRTATFERIKAIFVTEWVKSEVPKIQSIIKVKSRKFKERYDDYCATNKIRVEQLLWHGTRLGCHIGKTHRLCKKDNCSVCGIVSNGFSLDKVGTRDPDGTATVINSLKRFGDGLYFASNSSKSHDYSTDNCNCFDLHCKCAGDHALLLCCVATGTTYMTYHDIPHLKKSPKGCNSVTGIAGRDLQYPEIVVYNEEAIIPRYIVIYKMP